MADTPLRLTLKVNCISATGTDILSHPALKTGEVTVIAAVGTQARVVSRVKVLPSSDAEHFSGAAAPVFFDRVVLTGKEALSLTAGALGAVSVPLHHLEMDSPADERHYLISSANFSSDLRFEIKLTLTKGAMPAGKTAGSAVKPRAALDASHYSATAAANTSTPARSTTQRAQEPVVETVVLAFPAPAPAPAPEPAPVPPAASNSNTAENDTKHTITMSPDSKTAVATSPAESEGVPHVEETKAERAAEADATHAQTIQLTTPDTLSNTHTTTVQQPTHETVASVPSRDESVSAAASAVTVVEEAVNSGVKSDSAAKSHFSSLIGNGTAASASGSALPGRLVDYFGVMVSAEVLLPGEEEGEAAQAADDEQPEVENHPYDSDGEAMSGSAVSDRPARRRFRRRIGRLQYRYPKNNHEDVPLPCNVDWFIFPNGISPIVQATHGQSRPPTRKSIFVLQNVSNEREGTTMYGCCLTAYRKEIDEEDESTFLEKGQQSSSETLWWPVVLFMLSRYPIVPQLQVLLEHVYNVYDAGISTGAVESGALPKPYCNLQEYLRMLVYETPLPVRRMNLGVELFLPGVAPKAGKQNTCDLFLPSPDSMPQIQFDVRALTQAFSSSKLLAVLAAIVLEKKIVIIAHSVQELAETAETLLGLIYPLQWELPFIPVLPAHLASDCLSNPVPFVYGLLTSYAARVLTEITPSDAANLTIVDVTTGDVDQGIDSYLSRRRKLMADRGVPLPAADEDEKFAKAREEENHAPLCFPEPLQSEGMAELRDICTLLQSQPGLSRQEANLKLQSFMLRFFAILLHGYRSSTFFPGIPPQYSANLCHDVYVESKTKSLQSAAARTKGSAGKPGEGAPTREFISWLSETQMVSRLLQRHTSVYLRPFHSLTSLLSSSPSLAECKKWVAPTDPVAFTLVIPPPGYPQLKAWQLNTAAGDRLLPPEDEADLPPPSKPKRSKKEPKPTDAELARKWTTGEVADALTMDTWDAQELESLVSSYHSGACGPRGDDVGGSQEAMGPSAMSETAAILAAAAEAAGAYSNPVMRRRTASKAVSGRVQPRKKKDNVVGRWWRSGTENIEEESLGTQEVNERLHKWLQGCITTGSLPIPTSSTGASASFVTNVNGIPWFADDDAIVQLFSSSPASRGSFVYALQTQILLSAGLSAPLSGAVDGSALQLQPLLQLGVSQHTVETPWHQHHPQPDGRGQTGSATARTLLNQCLPVVRFQRLAALCAAMLSCCQELNDYSTAATLLQVSFFYYTEPQREAATAFAPVQAALATRRDKPASVGQAWNSTRQYLYQELSGEPIWRLAAFWEAYVTSALAVEAQQLKLLHMEASRRSPAAGHRLTDPVDVALITNASGTTYIFTLISSILSPMLQLGYPGAELATFIARISKKFRIPVGEERLAMSLIDSIVAVEAGGENLRQLNYYAVFTRGDAFTTAGAMTAGAGQAAAPNLAKERTIASPPLERNLTSPMKPSAMNSSNAPATPVASKPDAEPAARPPADPVKKSPAPADHSADTVVTEAVATAHESVPMEPAAAAPIVERPTNVVPPSTTVHTPPSADNTAHPTQQVHGKDEGQTALTHPWANLPAKDAENAARLLTALRRFPPVADPGAIARSKAKAQEPAKGDVALSSVMAAPLIPVGGLSAAPPVPVPGGMTVTVEQTVDAASMIKDSSKMPIVKKFGSMGLSVIASTFAAALPGKATVESSSSSGTQLATVKASDEEGLLDSALAALTSAARGGSLPSRGLAMSCFAFRGHAPGAAITAMSHAKDDHRVVTGGIDGRVTLWDMASRDYVHTYDDHSAAITSVRICGDIVVSASQDGSVRLSSYARAAYGLNAKSGTKLGDAPGGADDDEDSDADAPTSSAEVPPKPAASSGGSSTVPFVFPLPSFMASNTSTRGEHRFMSTVKITGHSGPVSAVDAFERIEEKKTGWFSKKGEASEVRSLPSNTNYVIVTGGTDGTVRTWTAKWKVNKRGKSSGTVMHLATHSSLHKSGTIVEQVKLSADGRLCVSVGRDGRVGVIDIATTKTWVMSMPTTSKGLFGRASSSAASVDPIAAPTGLPLVSCSIDIHSRPITITTCGADGTTRIWDLRTGSVVAAFPSGSPVWCFATVPAHGGGSPSFNADGTPLSPPAPLGDNYLVSGHEDGIVRKWDSRMSTVPMAQWTGHAGPVTSMSTQGDKVISGSADGCVRLWDATTGLSIRCDGHTGQVIGASVSDDYMLTSSWDGTLRCWFPTT